LQNQRGANIRPSLLSHPFKKGEKYPGFTLWWAKGFPRGIFHIPDLPLLQRNAIVEVSQNSKP
jgi:hypothetical protein